MAPSTRSTVILCLVFGVMIFSYSAISPWREASYGLALLLGMGAVALLIWLGVASLARKR